MLYAIIAEDKPGGLEHRLAVRPTHLEHLKTLGDRLVFAGPFLDAGEKPCGSLVVIDAPSQAEAEALAARDPFVGIDAPSQAEAEALAARDPFVAQGVFARYEVRRWNWGINNPTGR